MHGGSESRILRVFKVLEVLLTNVPRQVFRIKPNFTIFKGLIEPKNYQNIQHEDTVLDNNLYCIRRLTLFDTVSFHPTWVPPSRQE